MTDTDNRIVVTGAGLSGLAAAQVLAGAGLDVLVLEKSRGLGGRLATRRLQSGVCFDHGAQYVRARGPEFGKFIEHAVLLGNAAPWEAEGLSAAPCAVVGMPGMNALVTPLARGITVEHGCHVVKVTAGDDTVAVRTEDGRSLRCRFAVVTAPAPQAAQIVDSRSLSTQLQDVVMAPCWALLVRVRDGWASSEQVWTDPCPEIAWIARDNAKPMRRSPGVSWVVHASPQWSRRNLESDPEKIIDLLIGKFCRAVGIPPHAITFAMAHRWRFALVETALGRPFIANGARNIYCGGDWCLGPRAENAFLSGRAIAFDILLATSQ